MKLWTFYGEGAVGTGWGGVLRGDSVFDSTGDQEDSSRNYITLLQSFTGKNLA